MPGLRAFPQALGSRVTITELGRFSAVAFGNQYRLELLAALALADADQGICLTLLGDCCEVRPSVYYPPVKAMAAAGLVQTTGRVRSDRRVLYARNPGLGRAEADGGGSPGGCGPG